MKLLNLLHWLKSNLIDIYGLQKLYPNYFRDPGLSLLCYHDASICNFEWLICLWIKLRCSGFPQEELIDFICVIFYDLPIGPPVQLLTLLTCCCWRLMKSNFCFDAFPWNWLKKRLVAHRHIVVFIMLYSMNVIRHPDIIHVCWQWLYNHMVFLLCKIRFTSLLW